MRIFKKYEFTEVLNKIKKVYDIPSGKKVNLKFYENVGRWHIQIREGNPDGLGTGYEPGQGEWWTVEMWLRNKNRPEPVLLPK